MFTEVPRYVGFPNQVYCEKEFAFKRFEQLFKNKLPFFVSTFQFKGKDTPIVDNLYFDIDSYFSVRIPWRNVRLIKDWCYRRDIPYVINFSGGKGFHFYLMIKSEIPKTDKEKDKLRTLMYSVQMRIAKETKIEAYDEPTFARLRFLTRYPTSLYIREDEDTGVFSSGQLYCHNLDDELFDSGLKKIIRAVREPGVLPNSPKSDISLQDIADFFKDFKLIERSDKVGSDGFSERLLVQRAGTTVPTKEALGLPCLKELVSHTHPTHYERVELVAFLKFLGYTDIAINAFIKNCKWTRYSYTITSYQVRTVKPRYPKCSFLKKSYGHLCKNCILRKR